MSSAAVSTSRRLAAALRERLCNPVLSRETLLALRNRRSHYLLLLMLVGFGWVVLSNWRSDTPVEISADVFSAFALVSIVFTIHIAPLLTAGAITREREQKTFDMLATANLRPAGVLLGKLGAALGLYLLVFFIAAPMFALVLLLGGVSLGQFVSLAIWVVMLAVCYGMVGLAFSAWFHTSAAATLFATGYVFAVSWLPALLIVSSSYGQDHAEEIFLCPLHIVESISIHMNLYGQTFGRFSFTPSPMWRFIPAPFGLIPLTVLAVLGQAVLAFFLARIGYAAPRRARRVKQLQLIDDPVVLKERADKFPYYLIDPRKRRPPIPDRANPILRKDGQTLAMGNILAIIRSGYGAAALGLFLGTSVRFIGRDAWMFPTVMYFVTSVCAAVGAALSVNAERQGTRLDSLRAAGLPPQQWLFAKWWIPTRFAVVLALAAFPLAMLSGALMTRITPIQAVNYYATAIAFSLEAALLGGALGALAALWSRQLTAGLIVALVLAAVATICALDGRWFFMEPFRDPDSSPILGFWALHAVSETVPLLGAAALIALSGARKLLAPQKR